LNGDLVPEADLDIYVQDALNEIEFLTGSVDTKYGALRAKVGHPDPWTIRYVEVGNEDNLNSGLSSYKSYRFPAFYKAISEKYPDIQVLASTVDMTIPGTAGGDYHLYDIPDNFITKFDMFDSYSPEHPILLGEIAATETNNGVGIDWSNTYFSLYPWWIGSVAEAVFLLGAERNADKVIGTTYVSNLFSVSQDHSNPALGTLFDELG
jgi:alpha-N-arabinofuranosidase